MFLPSYRPSTGTDSFGALATDTSGARVLEEFRGLLEADSLHLIRQFPDFPLRPIAAAQ